MLGRVLLGLLVGSMAMVSSVAMKHPGEHVPLIVAHRGASYDAPENTLASFRLAWEQRADAIEGDFYLTSDGKIVCLHDKTFKRTGGGDERDVSKMTLAEATSIDVGSWKSPKFAGEKAPSLAEVLQVVPAGKLFLIEIKCGPEIVPELKRVIDASGIPLTQLRMISFNADVVAEVKKQIPALKSYWLTSFKKDEATGEMKPTLKEVLATLNRTKADGLDCKADVSVLTPEFVRALRDQAYEWHVWTVDDPALARRMLELGVDSVTTNKPGYLRSELSTSK